jgi:hypothetical protein
VPEPHAFAVRFSASRLRAVFAHGLQARPANTTTRPTLPRPPQPAPTFVTMANAPLPGRDGGICMGDLGVARRGLFLRAGLDGANHVEVVVENRDIVRR